MKINISVPSEILSQRAKLLVEAEELLAKLGRLNQRYWTKIYRIRKKIQQLEGKL